MTLNKREKILAATTGVLMLAAAGWFLLGSSRGSPGVRRADLDRLADEVNKKQTIVRRGEKAAARLAEWNQHSLPNNPEMARSLYQNWLLQLADRVGFQRTRVDPLESGASSASRKHGAFNLLSFSVRGQGSLEKLIQFLYEFYSAGHLHQIRHLTIKPLEKGQDLDLVFSIEALSLPGADRSDKLSTVPAKRLAHPSLADYRKVIVDRSLFAPYSLSKRVSKAPEPPKFDASKFAYFTGVTEVNGSRQVWLRSRTTGKDFQLSEGQPFEIDAVHGTVTRIGPLDCELEVDGTRHVVALGTNLRDGTSPPEGKSKD